MDVPDDVMDAWLKQCICATCQGVPCDGVMVGGMCDMMPCDCEDECDY